MMMQDNNWYDEELCEFEEPQEKKKSKKQSKRKWREIESYKEKQRDRKIRDMNEHYYSL
ncbi:MAG: DUF3545 family protein [Colwellia sp.]|nr:DUF3545 family protein [Colwellia sp.]MCW8866533.1 DUF3545 family protein [Colwellia sp.]MCW9079991.1 DUF3545 family protein [Colwellia sp.]